MTEQLRTTIALILLSLGVGGCSDLRPPTAPTPLPGPTPTATLIAFTEVGTGFSTTDLYDADDEILQINNFKELIWVADGTRLPGYFYRNDTIDGVSLHFIEGKICSPGCAFEVRFGAKDGARRAFLTVDYGHDNPGTVVDVELVQGQLVVTPTSTYPPGSPTLSGVVDEQTLSGRVPVDGAEVYVSISSGSRRAATDMIGFYEVRGLFDGSTSVYVTKDGYAATTARAPINGDTTFDIELKR